jgi:CDP-4-dehydro-6-deoxyglucose reductase, E1
MAHTLCNPFDLTAVTEFCQRHNLWLIEDNCDALGCRYDGKFTGTFGDLSTQSFYPPHHLTMGEGGAVNVVRDMKLKVLAESFRDWGRDCWCASGKDNTCNKRFGWKLGELPEGYDHKYIYSHLGYNLKPLDPQAAIGRQQLKKLPAFVQARMDNWNKLRAGLADLEEFIQFQLPTHATGWTGKSDMSSCSQCTSWFNWDSSGHQTECSWFGFMMLVKKSAPFTRGAFVKCLDAAKIGNRMLFGGNLARQPAFVSLRKQQPDAFRVVGDLAGADRIMDEAVFIGTYPGLSPAMIDYMVDTIRNFVRKH